MDQNQMGQNRNEFSIFHEIVEAVPEGVVSFFDAFRRASGEMTLPLEVEALNAAAEEEFDTCRTDAREAVLFKWFEVFRNIYIAKKVKDDKAGMQNHFVTFMRSFEPKVLLPAFWFGDDALAKGDDFRSHVDAICFAFERFLYSQEGAQAWGAIDFRILDNIKALLFELLRLEENGGEDQCSKEERVLERFAAIAMCVHAIATGGLQLHIAASSDEVQSSPKASISDVRNQLLKCYHYDCYTQLSSAHEGEFALSTDAQDKQVKFERHGAVLAAFSDLALSAMNALPDDKSVADAAYSLLHRYMNDSVGMLGKVCSDQLKEAIRKLLNFFRRWSLEPERPHSQAEILEKAGVERKVILANDYFAKHHISTAAGFWEKALPIFDEMVELIHRHRMKTISASPSIADATELVAKDLERGESLPNFDFQVILEAADKLWNHHLTANDACIKRWMLSIDKAIEIIETCQKQKFAKMTIGSFSWSYKESDGVSLLRRLRKEKDDFVKKGYWPQEMKELKKSFKDDYSEVTYETVCDEKKWAAEARYYVMLAVFAKLIVNTIKGHSELWRDDETSRNDRFFLFTYILTATNCNLDLPFHYHLGIDSGSYQRFGRTRNIQRNRLDRIVEEGGENDADRQTLLKFLAHYLGKSECRVEVMKAIKDNAFLKKCFGGPRINSLAKTLRQERR